MPAAMAVEAAGYFASADRLADKDLVTSRRRSRRRSWRRCGETPVRAPTPLAGKSDAEALAYLQKQKDRRRQIQTRIAHAAESSATRSWRSPERQGRLRRAGRDVAPSQRQGVGIAY